MLTQETLQLLQEGGLRPGRKYDGEFVASRCGRMLGGPDGRVAASPNGVFVTDSVAYERAIAEAGILVVKVTAFTKEGMSAAIEAAHSMAIRRGLRWMVGR